MKLPLVPAAFIATFVLAVPFQAEAQLQSFWKSSRNYVSAKNQEAYVKASNTNAMDSFGYGVSVSGDTLAVAAYREDSNATGIGGNQVDNSAADSGAVYVFTRSGSVWSQQAYIKASNSQATDNFGWSLSLSADTLAVGATGEDSIATGIDGSQADNSASNSGAVYVFTRSGATWSQQAYIKASNTGATDSFGYSVSVHGDTLAVSATGEDSNGTGVDSGTQANNASTDTGAVYVFTRAGVVWTQQAYIKASNTDALDIFGHSVGLFADTLAVGAVGEDSGAMGVNVNQTDNSASNAGAVYVFTRSGTVWTQQAYIKASNTGAGDSFGRSVSVHGDTLAVGASGEDSSAAFVNGNQVDDSMTDSGAVYVFTRAGTVWNQQAYIKASNPNANDYFGWSVSLSGDVLAVGAYGESSSTMGINALQSDNSAVNSGSVYLFKRVDGRWSRPGYIKSLNVDAGDAFGKAVSVDGNTLVVGAMNEDSNAAVVNGNPSDNSNTDSGAVYVFRF